MRAERRGHRALRAESVGGHLENLLTRYRCGRHGNDSNLKLRRGRGQRHWQTGYSAATSPVQQSLHFARRAVSSPVSTLRVSQWVHWYKLQKQKALDARLAAELRARPFDECARATLSYSDAIVGAKASCRQTQRNAGMGPQR